MKGKMSTFGGALDPGMKNDSGLALYEPWEADLRPDLFLPAPADNPKIETWKRLRTEACYIALRFDHNIRRKELQNTPYQVLNPKTGQWVACWLVDYGPGINTNRLVDVSPGIARLLRLETDDEVEVSILS